MSEEFILKLKAIGESAKNVLLYIMLPIVGIIAYIIYLKNKVTSLKEDLSVSKAEKDFAKSVDNLDSLKKEAQDAENDYDSSRDNSNK